MHCSIFLLKEDESFTDFLCDSLQNFVILAAPQNFVVFRDTQSGIIWKFEFLRSLGSRNQKLLQVSYVKNIENHEIIVEEREAKIS